MAAPYAWNRGLSNFLRRMPAMRIWIIGKKQLVIAAIILLALIGVGIVLGVRGCAPAADEASATQVEAYLSKERPVYYVQKEEKVVALTFDASWGSDHTPFILKTLADNDIKATFFLVRIWAEKYPEFTKEIAAQGHELGNHSSKHPHMNKLDKAGILKELKEMDDSLESIANARTTVFRAPFGEYNDLVINTVREAGYTPVQWNIDTLDWREKDPEVIVNRVLSKLEPGSIILCHNNGFGMETYLPAIIAGIKKQGYGFETVSQILLQGDTYVNHQGMQCPKPVGKNDTSELDSEETATTDTVKVTMKPAKATAKPKVKSTPAKTPVKSPAKSPAKPTPTPVD